jgi:hypothetical protein
MILWFLSLGGFFFQRMETGGSLKLQRITQHWFIAFVFPISKLFEVDKINLNACLFFPLIEKFLLL